MRTKIEKYAEALTALNSKDVLLTCDENEVINIDWQDTTPIDMVTIDAKVGELNTKYTANQYQRDREIEYPTWQDQLDMQYHDVVNSTTTWKDAVAKVKSDNPKG